MARALPKILIVDDSDVFRYDIVSNLSRLKIECVEASSGVEAIELVKNNDFFLILLDITMPDMDGFETATRISALNNTVDPPIIFMTALNPNESLSRKGYEVGAVDYINKPFDSYILNCKVKVFLNFWTQTHAALPQANQNIHTFEHSLREAVMGNTKALVSADVERDVLQPLGRVKGIFHSVRRALYKSPNFNKEAVNEELEYGIKQLEQVTETLDAMYDIGNKVTLPMEPLSVDNILDNAIVLLSDDLKAHHIDVECDVAQELPLIYGNEGRLEQVVTNLIQNSLQALLNSAPDNRKIRIVAQEDIENSRILLHIEDNAQGVDEKLVDAIFSGYYATKEQTPSQGTGLWTVNQIVKEHHGTIDCYSEAGKGANFTLSLPC